MRYGFALLAVVMVMLVTRPVRASPHPVSKEDEPGDTGSAVIRIEHCWQTTRGNSRLQTCVPSLGTLIESQLILTHNHFHPQLGHLEQETLRFSDTQGNRQTLSMAAVTLSAFDRGTLTITLPAPLRLSVQAAASDPACSAAALEKARVTVFYWDDRAGQITGGSFQVTQVKDGTAVLADPQKVINGGDSGGGVFLGKTLIGNTWRIYADQAGRPLGSFEIALWPCPSQTAQP